MLLKVDSVGEVVAAMTREFEVQHGAISAMEASKNQFENWWKGALFLEFTKPPWNRTPGRRPSLNAGVGVGMECTWQVTDQRLKYSTRKKATGGRGNQNRVDLVVRSAPTGERFHLIELKLFDRTKDGWPIYEQVGAIRKDMRGLQSLVWSEVASAWSIVLGLRFSDKAEFIAGLEDATEDLDSDVHALRIHDITETVWLGARRVV